MKFTISWSKSNLENYSCSFAKNRSKYSNISRKCSIRNKNKSLRSWVTFHISRTVWRSIISIMFRVRTPSSTSLMLTPSWEMLLIKCPPTSNSSKRSNWLASKNVPQSAILKMFLTNLLSPRRTDDKVSLLREGHHREVIEIQRNQKLYYFRSIKTQKRSFRN